MRWRSILSEASRNISSGTAFPLVAALSLAISGAGLAVAYGLPMVAALERLNELESAGASTVVVESVGAIDGAACDRLRESTIVHAAGALRSASGDLMFLQAPATRISRYEITEGMSELLARARDADGALLSEPLAHQLGVGPGDLVPTSLGPLRVAALADFALENPRGLLEYAVLEPARESGPFDQCWISYRAADISASSLLDGVPLIGSGDAQETQTFQLDSSFGSDLELRRFEGQQLPPLAYGVIAVGLGALIGGSLAWTRRVEIALARQLGVSLTSRLLIQAVEAAVLIAAAAILVAPVIVSFGLMSAAQGEGLALALDAARPPAMLLAAHLLGSLAVCASIRGDRLYRHFRER